MLGTRLELSLSDVYIEISRSSCMILQVAQQQMPLGEGLARRSTRETYAKARGREYVGGSDYRGLGSQSWK